MPIRRVRRISSPCGGQIIPRLGALSSCLLTVLISQLLASTSFAQVNSLESQLIPKYEDFLPKEPKRKAPEVQLPEPPEPEVGDNEKELLDELKGIILISNKDDVVVQGLDVFEGIEINGLEQLDNEDFRKTLTPYLKKPVSLKQINELVRDIVNYYRSIDQPVVDIVVPEQEITTKVIQFVVLEGRVNEVKVEGNKWFSDWIIKKDSQLSKGDRILAKPLIDDLQIMNRNQFREVNVVFEPGEDTGETDVIFKVEDRFPVRAYTGYEDTGNDLAGDERWFVGVNWGNAFFADHLLSYQYTTSSDFEKLQSHSVNYSGYAFKDHQFRIFGAYSSSKAFSFDDAGTTKFDLTGTSWQLGARYNIPLPSPYKFFTHDLELGYDFKRSNNDLISNGQLVFDDFTDVNQFLVAYQAQAQDPFGTTSFRMDMITSPGGWTPQNKDRFFVGARAFADAEYTYFKLKASRITRLPFDFTLSTVAQTQFADANLLSSEQFRMGGFNTVRGYDESEARGDNGYLYNIELITPPVSVGQTLGFKGAKDELRFIGFWDYGVVTNVFDIQDANPDIELSGAGAGIRYNVDRYLSIRADYGFQLLGTGLAERHDSRWHLGFILSY